MVSYASQIAAVCIDHEDIPVDYWGDIGANSMEGDLPPVGRYTGQITQVVLSIEDTFHITSIEFQYPQLPIIDHANLPGTREKAGRYAESML